MKKIIVLLFLLCPGTAAFAQFGKYPPFTKWYQNPLGFQPLNLHTSAGLIVPGAIAGICLLLTKKDTTLARKIVWFDEIGVSKGYIPSYTTAWQNNAGLLFFPRRWLALGAEFNTYHVTDDLNNTWGFGLRPFVRFYPLNGARFRLYFESGAGVMYFLEKFPQPTGFFGDNRTGTNWNGSPKYGIGAEWQLDPNISLQLAVRHVHVSNGNTWGTENNPGHDSNGVALGVLWHPN